MVREIEINTGFEWELVAPKGQSRYDLATTIAKKQNAKVETFFHRQLEPDVRNQNRIFHNLTKGFRVLNNEKKWICSVVDDLTLQNDFDKNIAPLEGWYRVISDDSRLLRLVEHHCNPDEPTAVLLEPIAELYRSRVTDFQSLRRVCDSDGQAIVAAAPYPGERERATELISAPIDSNHFEIINGLLTTASDLGFQPAKEAATHIHFNGEEFKSATCLSRLILFFARHRKALMSYLRTNPENVRIAGQPQKAVELVSSKEFAASSWESVCQSLLKAGLSKFSDLNLVNLLTDKSKQQTIEFRIIGPTIDPAFSMHAALACHQILRWAKTKEPIPEDIVFLK